MKVRIDFLLTHESDVYEISRVPCIGELVYNVDDDDTCEVVSVMHAMNADPETQAVAVIRVK